MIKVFSEMLQDLNLIGALFAREILNGCAVRFITSALLSISLTILGFGPSAHASDLTELGTLPGAIPVKRLNGISGDGLLPVGGARDNLGRVRAYYWTQPTGMVDMGTLGGAESEAFGASFDGSTVVGVSDNVGGNIEAFRWTTGGMVGLGTLGGLDSMAYATNTDGSVVVGVSKNVGAIDEAFRWTTGGMVGLGSLSAGATSEARGVNSDGSVVVGFGVNAGGNDEAFRWTTGGMIGLGTLGGANSDAVDVSADGSVVIGMSNNADGSQEAYRWTQTTAMVGLGNLGGGFSQANAVNKDGSIIVGRSLNNDGNSDAFVWTDLGMRSVNDMLISAGVDMTGVFVETATGISDDGSTIVGEGVNAVTPFATFLIRDSGITTAAALDESLAELSSVASDISCMAMETMRAIMDQATRLSEPNTTRLWIVGSLLGDGAIPGQDIGGEGGFGITKYLANGLSLGGGMFAGRRNVDTKYGGSQDSNMFGPGAFINYAPEIYGWRAKLGILYEHASLELNRGYTNGGGTTVASGSTSGHLLALNSHLGWIHPITNVIAIQPYVEYELQATILDAYTEKDTPFPAYFKERKDVMKRSRLGCKFSYAKDETLALWSWAAWSHRFETKGPSMSGHMIGMNEFSYGGGPVDRNWGEVGGGIKYKPNPEVETFSRITVAIDNQYYAAPDVSLTSGVAWKF